MVKPSRVTAIFLVVGLSLMAISGLAQTTKIADDEIRKLVQSFKADPRGPYQGIRWFCPDGTIRPARDPCPEPGGHQHALHKEIVQQIARDNHIFLGQIVTDTKHTDFLDADNQFSRMKQYQMERFLREADDGWILRKAQFYRGALQAEDEERWGLEFLVWLLSKDEMLADRFYLCRAICGDIPHRATDNRLKRIRALSKSIAEAVPAFMDLRVKIHGQPEASDLDGVRAFLTARQAEMASDVREKLQTLAKEMESVYRAPAMEALTGYLQRIPKDAPIFERLSATLDKADATLLEKCHALADLLWDIREQMINTPSARTRLAMLDLSMEVEELLFRRAQEWQPQTVGELFTKAEALTKAAVGCGYLEVWEWHAMARERGSEGAGLSLDDFLGSVDQLRRGVEWSAGMLRAVYEPVVRLFGGFEPLAFGFIDDRIRGSILLPLGQTTDHLSSIAAQKTGLSNRVFDLEAQHQIRGLNPGFAKGKLQVVVGMPTEMAFSDKEIYALQHPPADMKPVAGIATVSEGNTVSHVQLLARNLGIPNAAISSQALHELMPFSGQEVFYAVSPRGAVVLKLAAEMTSEEALLFAQTQRREEKITVPTGKIVLTDHTLVDLYDLRASDSGRMCGPKAANLGQLSHLFPDQVAPGFIIPFGVFRRHMDAAMPGTSDSYWDFLQQTFSEASRQRTLGKSEEDIEAYVLLRLGQLREAIKQIPFLPEFEDDLQRRFNEIFGVEIGQVLVFIRSDTNMEDLKDFTGAGLNLTVANVLAPDKVLQAIRDVWASPFTERSYRWRQKYLLNPENVYPSILILRSVNVAKSGVMITTGIASGEPRDTTVAFNRGVGGAVEGQAAESYLLQFDGRDRLLAPARDTQFMTLPTTGGTQKRFATFETPILSVEERAQLRQLSSDIRAKLPGTPGIESQGPFDVELGFLDGKIWLFQARPFVENRRSTSSTYLRQLDPPPPEDVQVSLTASISDFGFRISD